MAATKLQRVTAEVLVDTSVWVEFIRFGNPQLSLLLNEGRVLMHDMVIGEIACGNAPRRSERLAVMHNLPKINQAEHADVFSFSVVVWATLTTICWQRRSCTANAVYGPVTNAWAAQPIKWAFRLNHWRIKRF